MKQSTGDRRRKHSLFWLSADAASLQIVGMSVAILLVFLVAWQWLPAAAGIPSYILPPPARVWEAFVSVLQSERLMFHVGVTAAEVVSGFAIGTLLGAAIGCVLGLAPRAEMVLSPYILALQIAPKVAFAPLFVMWLGFTIYPKILVAVLIVFFPVMVNVLTAIRTIDSGMIDVARSFNANRWQIFRMIQVPATMPPFFAGLRIASTLSVIGVVVGEMVGGNKGLGYLLVLGQGRGDTATVFVSIIMLTVIGILGYGAVVVGERRVLHYLPRAHYTVA